MQLAGKFSSGFAEHSAAQDSLAALGWNCNCCLSIRCFQRRLVPCCITGWHHARQHYSSSTWCRCWRQVRLAPAARRGGRLDHLERSSISSVALLYPILKQHALAMEPRPILFNISSFAAVRCACGGRAVLCGALPVAGALKRTARRRSCSESSNPCRWNCIYSIYCWKFLL